MIETNNSTNADTKAIRFFTNLWAYIKMAKLELLLLLGFAFVDIMTKYIVEWNMSVNQRVDVIPNFFSWHYVINTGAAFGLGAGTPWAMILFYIITPLALIGFFAFLYFFRGQSKWARISFAAIIAGTLGNFWDRIFYSGVRDFIAFQFGSWQAPIFNIADIFLVVGVAIFAVWFIFFYKPPKPALVGPVFQADWGKEKIEESIDGDTEIKSTIDIEDKIGTTVETTTTTEIVAEAIVETVDDTITTVDSAEVKSDVKLKATSTVKKTTTKLSNTTKKTTNTKATPKKSKTTESDKNE